MQWAVYWTAGVLPEEKLESPYASCARDATGTLHGGTSRKVRVINMRVEIRIWEYK